jgi:hypothetical protein
MIYITQLIFVKEGKEATFLEFESLVIPLMKRYEGKVIYRVRPNVEQFIDETKETPYEIHFVSFESEKGLNDYLNDKSRLDFMHLKDDSVNAIIAVKGEKL